MGDFDVATIKSMFEKGAQDGSLVPKGRSMERRRTIATLGLSPGTLQTHKKSSARRNSQKQVRIAPIPRQNKVEETEDKKKTENKVSKPATTKSVTINTSMNRRKTMPAVSYSFVPPQNKANINTTKSKVNDYTANKAKIKTTGGLKAKDSSSESKSERISRSIKPLEAAGGLKAKDSSSESKSERISRSIKPTFSGKRNFFDRQSSTASDTKVAAIRRSKLKAKATSPRKGEISELKQNSKSVDKTTEKKNVVQGIQRVVAEPKKASKFAYTSIIKDRRASAYAATDSRVSSDGGQSLLSDPFPMRRQSLSALPLPEHESVDINDFHRSHSHTLGLDEGEGKKTVTREKDMNFLKDRKTVTSMIQQFSSQPTPTHENKSNQVHDIHSNLAEPPPPPIQEDDSVDVYTLDDSEIIEEVTVVSEYTPSSSRRVDSDGDEDYSYEEVTAYDEVTATEADDFTETDSFMMSSVGMETASRVSYTPSMKSQRRVVVDFQNMEVPISKMKEKHLKVVKDLDLLMTKSANQPETKVQRSIKDKMMQDLLHSNKSLVTDGVRQALLQADLTIHEVSEIVAHLNMCEETKLPIRWDLIKDIVYPDGIIEEETSKAFEEAMKEQGATQSNLPPISPSRAFSKKGQANMPTGKLGIAAAQELFRNQYDLSKDDMDDIVAHLTLCEETGTTIRWDLIYQIVYPEDEMSAEDSQTDPGSMMIDVFDDNESVTSWYSIYPEFDECGSEITFNVDEEDEVGSLPGAKATNQTGPNTDGVTGQQLLRERIEQLQLASGKQGSFQVHRRKKGV